MTLLTYLQIAIPKLAEGLLITFRVSFICLGIGLLIGFPAALARVYGPKWLRILVTGYIEILRGTPVLVQLFLVYYGLPQFGLTLTAFYSAYIALGLNSSAYQAEYFRGAIQAISSGQMMAKYFNPFQTYITVGVIYLLVIGAMSIVLNRMEQRLTIPVLDLAKRGGG